MTGNPVPLFLSGGEGASYSSDMCVVPGVVVNEDGSVSHACNLVPVVPPGEDSRVGFGVVPEPGVSFPIVVHNMPCSITAPTRHDNRRGSIGLTGEQRGMVHLLRQNQQDEAGESHRHVKGQNAVFLLELNLGLVLLGLLVFAQAASIFTRGGFILFRLRCCFSINLAHELAEAFAGARSHHRENLGDSNTSNNAHNRCKGQHETNHDAGEVGS